MTVKADLQVATRVDDHPAGRHYRVPPEGDLYPSVTNILKCTPKPALIYWAANEERKLVTEAAYKLYDRLFGHLEKLTPATFRSTLATIVGDERAHVKQLNKAANIGTQAHALIEWTLRAEAGEAAGAEPVTDNAATIAYGAWELWRDGVDLAPVYIERMVWSHDLEVAGTVDLFAELNYGGARCQAVCDWKTSKGLYLEHKIQIATYRECLIEMGLAEPDCLGVVLRLEKTKPAKNKPAFEPHVLMPDECEELVAAVPDIRAVWQFLVEQGVRF